MEPLDLQTLVERCYPQIYRAALVMTGCVADAEDLTQETFLQAMRSWRRYRGKSRVETWVYAILLNQRRRMLRTQERRWRRMRVWRELFPFRTNQSQQTNSPERSLQLEEWRQSIWSAVAELPESQRHALVLRYSEGLSCAEAAEVMNCPVGTIKSRLHHGIQMLQQKLGGEELDWVDVDDLGKQLCSPQFSIESGFESPES